MILWEIMWYARKNGVLLTSSWEMDLTMILTACFLRPGSCQVPFGKPQSQKASAVKYSRWKHGE